MGYVTFVKQVKSTNEARNIQEEKLMHLDVFETVQTIVVSILGEGLSIDQVCVILLASCLASVM
jgi:hypothetical protein